MFRLTIISLLTGMLLFSFFSIDGQENKPVLFCGIGHEPVSQFHIDFFNNFDEYTSLRSNNELLILPLTIHIIGQSDGSGYYSLRDLMINLCDLNAQFSPQNIQFYIKDEIRYHNNTNWYNHASFAVGSAMATVTAVPNTINLWIANDAAGAAGYAPFGANRLFLSKSGIRGSGSTTIAHEMGHCFELRHTFSGWEGRNYAQGQVAPSTLNLGGQVYQVERLDRSNCSTAADGFCDTDPDYLSFRWNCNANGETPFTLSDPTGADFIGNGRNYMSYSNDQCQDGFSAQQSAFMRAHILSANNNMIFQGSMPEPFEGNLELVFPQQDDEVHFENIRLTWRKHPNATLYHVTVARNATLGLLEEEFFVTDTFATMSRPLDINRNYFYRVLPISDTDFCASPTSTVRFRSVSSTSTTDIAGNTFNVFPTLMKSGNDLIIEGRTLQSMNLDADIIDLTGKVIASKRGINISGSFRETFSIPGLNTGVYFVRLHTPISFTSHKIIVQ